MENKSEDGQSDGSEDCYSEDTFDTVNCHICNVKVPVLCFERHNESEKHVALKSIFQKVLERVSNQININVINNDEDLDKDVYFCVPCSKIIRIENQPKHESSEYHVKSRRSIDVVHEFYKIFQENKGYVAVKEIGKEEIVDEKRYLSANKVCTEMIQNDTKNNNVKDVSNEDKTKIVCPANDHTNTIKPSCTVDNEELTSEEKYFNDMVKKYNLKVNLPIVDGDFIKVASPSGVKVKIPRDYFHSYQSIVEGNRVHCQMCTTWSELGEENKHKLTEEHVRNIFLPVNEKFARTLNDYSIHCLICNKVTRLLSIHICQNNEDLANSINTENIGQTHSENKRNKCINNKEYISKLDLSENDLGNRHMGLIFCELCNVDVPQDQIEYHNAGTPHWSNAFKNICKNVPGGLQAYFSKDSFKTDGDLSGKQNYIPKNDNITRQNDISGNDNVAKQNDISENDNVAIQNDISENDNLTKENDILKNDNVTKQNDFLKNDNVTKQNNIPKNDNVTKQNITSENDNVAKQNKISESDNVTKQNDILKNDNVTKQNDIPKNDNVAKQNDIPKSDNAASSTVSNIATYAYKLDRSRSFRFADSTENKVTCIVCDIDIPTNDSRIITNHEESSDHRKCLQNLLNFHIIQYQTHYTSYYCGCCQIYIPTESYYKSNIWAHISTEQHIALLQNNFEIDPEPLKFYVHTTLVRNGQGIMYSELHKMFLQCNQIIRSDNIYYYCSFCKVTLHAESGEVIDHIANHEKLLKIILGPPLIPRKKR